MTETSSSPQTRRLALLLEYDGASYAGSQLQPNAPTVQSVLEEAIESVTGEKTRAAFAGRTDAGVHARGQVASFITETCLDVETVCRALNARLPEDVAVSEVAEVSLDFDPRRNAVRRHYRYVIDNGRTRPVLERDRVWYVGHLLDAEAMTEAAQGLVGKHDFAPFAGPMDPPDASTIRTLHRFDVSRRGHTISFDVSGDAFLPHQVRRMVGSLITVGKNRQTPADYVGLLGAPASSVGPAAPAHGLYLMRIDYDPPLFASQDACL